MTNIKDHVLIDTITEIVEESEEGGGTLPFGESNTASNIGTEGEGLFDHKEGVDLQFKNLEAGDNVILTPDEVKHTVKIDALHISDVPPAKTSMIWFNTTFKKLFYYDSVRTKWLSIQSTIFAFGANSADGNALNGSGIVTPAIAVGLLVPVAMTITDVWAKAVGGPGGKIFYLRNGGIAGTIINQFSLVGRKYSSVNVDDDIAAAAEIWSYASSTATASTGITITYLAKQRYVS